MSTFGHGRKVEEIIYHCVHCPHFKVQTFINPFKPLPGGCMKANIPIYDATWGDIPENCPLPRES
jgi:hypothetical protein